MPYEEACRIIRDAAKGLAHLHKNDVVHRDLRPANIWLTDQEAVKIMEFGAARDWFASTDASENEVEVTSSHVREGWDEPLESVDSVPHQTNGLLKNPNPLQNAVRKDALLAHHLVQAADFFNSPQRFSGMLADDRVDGPR